MRTQEEYTQEVQDLANELRVIINQKKPVTGILYGAVKLLILEIESSSKEGWRAVFDSKQVDAALMQRFFLKEMQKKPKEESNVKKNSKKNT